MSKTPVFNIRTASDIERALREVHFGSWVRESDGNGAAIFRLTVKAAARRWKTVGVLRVCDPALVDAVDQAGRAALGWDAPQ